MHPSKKAQRLEEIKKLRLFDDILMNQVFQNKTCAEFLLRTILNKESLVVTDVHTQESFNNLHGRGVRLDIFAYDKDTQYDIEVQRANEGASPLRARYNSSLLDANALEKGESFEKLPNIYIIFITENGAYCKGKAVRIARRMWDDGEEFGDHTYIVYVNGQYRGEDALGDLMHDFRCTDPDDMVTELANEVNFYKNVDKGVSKLSEIIERIYGDELAEERAKSHAEGRAEGRAEGLSEGRAEGMTAFISVLAEMEFSSDAIISKIAEKFGMSKDEASKEYEKYA